MTTRTIHAIKKKPSSQAWHKADIKAALEKKGYNFGRIAREYGYRYGGPNMVLYKSWSQMERIIAEIIEIPASVIWPDRYDRDGRPLKVRAARIKLETK